MSIRLLIADDHEVVREGLASLLAETDINIVASAASGSETLAQAAKHHPDVVLLDIRMPDGDGLATLDQLKQDHANMPVVILSTYDNPSYLARAAALGAVGYLRKGCSRNDLLEAIRGAAQGKNVWNPVDLQRVSGVSDSATSQPVKLDAPLTQREVQVLRQLAFGLSNKEIAKALHISVETVKEHVQHVLKKLNVSHRTQAAVWAVKRGLV